MKNVNAKNFSSVTNQITAIERYETKKLNMSTLDKNAIVTMVFRKYDVTPTILLELSLRVATL